MAQRATPAVMAETVGERIVEVRGVRVLLDVDLATLYGVNVKALNQAVSRNPERFPDDFAFYLEKQEVQILKSQTVTSRSAWGGARKPPRAFTEQGVAMLSSVLRSERAALVNVAIMRAFVRLRSILAAGVELDRRVSEAERRIEEHDEQIRTVFDAIGELMAPPAGEPKRIGFRSGAGEGE